MRIAYFDCIGGIAGDMALGALLDAGADQAALVEGLKSLGRPDWELQVGRTSKCGIAANTVEVMVRGEAAGSASLVRLPPSDSPREDAAHSHSHEHSHSHDHSHSPEHGHSHAHSHVHSPDAGGEGSHTHEHSHSHADGELHGGTRTFADVESVIRRSGLPEVVKERSVAVYRRLAAAEAAVHGMTLETVHFHEVGAIDSIVDEDGVDYALHLLGVEQVVCSPLPSGKGFVRCAHGLMPVPAPATAELLVGCPIRPVDVEGELVTPTGAALAGALAERFGGLPAFTPRSIGYGAGRKDFPFPNVVRVVVGETESPGGKEATEVVLIEANIDDQSPQLYDSAMTALFAAGALDAWLAPIQMKKGRPAHTLSVLCEPGDLEKVTQTVFRETSTLGVRYSRWDRTCLDREWVEIETAFGAVRVKVGRLNGEALNAAPEYEDCRRRAEERGVPLKQVYAAAAAAAWGVLRAGG